jgi:uncharacterized membrane protein
MRVGDPVDPRLGAAGKQRSVHNNYMTLPVVFIMVSNHYPIVTGHSLNWLLMALLGAAGVSVRHFFNLRHIGRIRPAYLGLGAALFAGTVAVATLVRPSAAPPPKTEVSFARVQVIVGRHCVMCHAATPSHAGFSAPPGGLRLDSPAAIIQNAPRLYPMAVTSQTMPLGNETGMTMEERAELGAWIKAGAKGS